MKGLFMKSDGPQMLFCIKCLFININKPNHWLETDMSCWTVPMETVGNTQALGKG